MAVTNTALMTELRVVQGRLNELSTAIVDYGKQIVALETWRNGHEKNEHTHLQKQIEAGQQTQQRQGDRLWKVALQVANLAALLAAITKMAGAW